MGLRGYALSTHQNKLGKLKKKKAAREEDARPDLEYGLGGGVPYSLSSSGRRSELDEEMFTRHLPQQQRPLMHISYAKTLTLTKKAGPLERFCFHRSVQNHSNQLFLRKRSPR